MGLGYPGTSLASTSAARGAEFRRSPRRDVVDFGRYSISSPQPEGGPDLDNAVSTLVARAFPSSRAGAPKYWLRRVHVITLAEVFDNYKNDWGFETIYDAWREGRVVIKKRAAMRGCAGGRRKK